MKYGNGFVGLFALGWTGTQKAGVTLELFSRILNQKIDQKKSEGWTLGYFTPDCPWWLLITGIKKTSLQQMKMIVPVVRGRFGRFWIGDGPLSGPQFCRCPPG